MLVNQQDASKEANQPADRHGTTAASGRAKRGSSPMAGRDWRRKWVVGGNR